MIRIGELFRLLLDLNVTLRYYVRCASLARHLYFRGNAGVGAFRKVYGGSKDNGFAPSHFRVANGNIIRKVSV